MIAQGGNAISHSTALLVLFADMHQSAHESAGSDHDCRGSESHSQVGDDTCDPVNFDDQLGDVALVKIDSDSGFDLMLGAKLICLLVTLSSRCTNTWSLSGIEHPKLDSRGVGILRHKTAEGIDLAYHVPLGQTPNGWVAGHLANGVEILGHHTNRRTYSGRSECRFNAAVACTDDQHVVVFGILKHDEVGWRRLRE